MGAAALGGFMRKGIEDAADFETALTKAGVATSATAAQLVKMHGMILGVSGDAVRGADAAAGGRGQTRPAG
jgi:hypothetical protein